MWGIGRLLVALAVTAAGQAQIDPFAQGDAWQRQEQAAREREAARIERISVALRRALEHERMRPLDVTAVAGDHCPFATAPPRRPVGSRAKASKGLVPRYFGRRSPEMPADVAIGTERPVDLFRDLISNQVIQAKCINCHVAGGLSGHTRLVFVPATSPDHASRNFDVLSELVIGTEGAGSLILAKVQGIGHGGGLQVPTGSQDLKNLERFLRKLEASADPGAVLTPEGLFDGVSMSSPSRTLWRAALLLAGRLPTDAELASVRAGGTAALRRVIRRFMAGPAFHEFLIRSSNDRLMTDRFLQEGFPWRRLTREFVALARKHEQLMRAAVAKGYDPPWGDPDFWRWEVALDYGLARAPLELIAYVIENDRPYTEILTAPYIMANPVAAEVYGATTQFIDRFDPTEFRPSKIQAYYRTDASKKERLDRLLGRIIEDPGNLLTDYPHAGILNTSAFLRRYPSTDTSRNRARSRWTYYHFLGVDIEKAASRTTDPAALVDTGNPTLNNPACTVCHRIMDPVAGAFQNYGDHGLYKERFGGLDSLSLAYKQDPNTLYRYGDRWYRDMLPPGFGPYLVPNPDQSLRWLAHRIVEDERFAEAAVKFWWPAIMGVEVTLPPEDAEDPGSAAQLLAAAGQHLEVQRIAEGFRRGFGNGRPYDAKDLLVEIFMSPWFRADRLTASNPVRREALRDAGAARLLTPEELERKTEAVTGYVWGRSRWRMADHAKPIDQGFLSDRRRTVTYKLLYGGIDSKEIITRTAEITPVMLGVARAHAAEVSCPVVTREFFFWPPQERRLFKGIDQFAHPGTPAGSIAIRKKIADLHRMLLGIEAGIGSRDVEDTYALFVEVWNDGDRSPEDFVCLDSSLDQRYWEGLLDSSLFYTADGVGYRFDWDRIFEYTLRVGNPDPFGTVRPWVVVLNYLLTDYRFLHL